MDDIRPLLDDDIDLVLSRSAPITPLALAVRDDELQIAAAGARLEAARRHRHRRTPRVAAFTAVAVLMLGGAGVAVAATNESWPAWAASPDLTLAVTLPSGVVCDYRIGNLEGAAPDISRAAHDILAAMSVPTTDQVDDAVVAIHGESLAESPASKRDDRYELGVIQALAAELDQALQEQGFDAMQRPNFEGVITCPEVGE